MADTNKLWFEMGVRDHVTSSLNDLLKLVKRLGGEMDKVTIEAARMSEIPNVRIGNSKALRNALAYQNMLLRISTTLSSISSKEARASIGGEKFAAARKELEDFQRQLENLSNKGNFWNGDLLKNQQAAFRNVMESVRNLLGEQRELERTMREQERATSAANDKARESARINREWADTYERVTNASSNTSKVISQMQQQFSAYLSLYGFERILKNIIEIGGEFEVQHLALQNILGDVQQANSMFEQMKELAVESPFNFRQLATYAKQLSAFNVPYEEMYDTTKRLADMSAGLGVDMNRLILAYGQVRSAAVLRGQELRQFTEAGIPMVQALADEFTKLNGRATSTSEVFELISKRAVPFEMVKKVLWDMTSEGGRFYDMQYTLADTLSGKWSNLQDAWEIMLSDFAKGESLTGKILKNTVEFLTKLVTVANKLTPFLGLVGALSALRWVERIAVRSSNFGLNGVEANINRTQALYAIEQRRKLLNLDITRAQYDQAMGVNRNRRIQYMILANEGKLKGFQIARLIQQKKINLSRIEERLAAGEITRLEAAQLRLWRMKYAQAGAFKVMMREIGVAVKSALGPFGIALLAIDAIATGLISWKGHLDEIEQKNKELTEGFSNRANEVGENLKTTDSSLSSDEAYKSGIEGLKEMLRVHSSNYDAIMLEASGIEDLAKRYQYLRGELAKTKESYEKAGSVSSDFADDLRDDFEDAKTRASEIVRLYHKRGYEKDVLNLFSQISRHDDIDQYIEKIANRTLEYFPDISTDAIEADAFRKLRDALLMELGTGARESKIIRVKLNELLGLDGENEVRDEVQSEFTQLLESVTPEIANKIRYGKELDEAEQEKVQSLMDDAIKKTRDKYPEFANMLQTSLNNSKFTAMIQLRIANSSNANEVQRAAFAQLPPLADTNLVRTVMGWGEEGTFSGAAKKAKTDIDAAGNELKSLESAMAKGIVGAEKVSEQRTKYETLVSAALTGYGYDYVKEKNEKENGKTKKDHFLESMKLRVSVMKDVMSEYKKYFEVFGRSEAIRRVQLLFPEANVSDIVEHYKSLLNKVASAIGNSTNARAKEQQGIWRLIGDLDLEEAKRNAKQLIDVVERSVKEKGEQWSLWKTLLERTGDADFADVAFSNGRIFDGLTRGLRMQLKSLLGSAADSLDFGDTSSLWSMDRGDAENLLGKETAAFRLWERIVTDTSKNWRDALTKSAEAMEKQLNTAEKIAKVESEIAALQAQASSNPGSGVNYNALISAKQRERLQLQSQAYKEGAEYLRYYGAVLTMTHEEANRAARDISSNLMRELTNGTIKAKEYTKAIKDVDAQLEKSNKAMGGNGMAFLTGGLDGVTSRYWDKQAQAAMEVEQAQERLNKAREQGDEKAITLATNELTNAQIRLENANAELESLQRQRNMLQSISTVFSLVQSSLQGLQAIAKNLSDMFYALGNGSAGDVFSDIGDGISAITSAISPVSNVLKSAMSGDVGSVMSNLIQAPVSLITSPITAFAKLHDKRRDREIKRHQQEVAALSNLYSALETQIQRSLGGVYSAHGFNDMLDNLKQQREEMAGMLSAEEDKKDSDAAAIENYRKQIEDMDIQIADFAKNMAKEWYGIDVKSWAQSLGDALFDAWKKGENGAEAFRKKAKEIIADTVKNIVSMKVIETALKPLENAIEKMMVDTNGELDPIAVTNLLTTYLSPLAEKLPAAVNTVLDAADAVSEANGWGSLKDIESSNSGTNAIKSITEDQTNLLLSYVDSMRADLSVHSREFQRFMDSVVPGLSSVFSQQLAELRLIEANTHKSADNSERIYELLNSVKNGVYKLSVKAM